MQFSDSAQLEAVSASKKSSHGDGGALFICHSIKFPILFHHVFATVRVTVVR